jgi:ABC-type antimicrobial peptide transport system permease subunit
MNNIFDLFLDFPVAGVVAMLVASIIGGVVFYGLILFLTKFLRGNMPSSEQMTRLEKQFAPKAAATSKPLSPNAEPLVVAVIGFVSFFILGGFLLSQIPVR